MDQEEELNPQILNTVQRVYQTVCTPQSVSETGSAKAFNFVAQATAMAIQDATDNLRNVSTMSTTAIGVAMTQLINSGDQATWGPVVVLAQGLVTKSASDFDVIGSTAARILRQFPPFDLPTACDPKP